MPGRLSRLLICGICLSALPELGANAGQGQLAVEKCTAAAQALLAALTPDIEPAVALPFDDRRMAWSYFPNIPQLVQREEGAPLEEMTQGQRLFAHQLMECGLSSQGYQKVTAIMRLGDPAIRGPAEGRPIGPTFFWLAVFGDPATDEPWGWQLEGHHLALNFTLVDGEISFTPMFLGADPARVPSGPYAGWRVLGNEVDKAFALLNALTATQRSRAILADEIPERFFTQPGRADALKTYAGLPGSALTNEQRQLLWSFIGEYVLNIDDSLARQHLEAIRDDGLDTVYFAWMGPTTPGSGIYYRIHGPSILIEFTHARNQGSGEPDPNHVHTVLRDPGNDFGQDWLRIHYETSPDHQNQGD
jgi:hypothetical protein